MAAEYETGTACDTVFSSIYIVYFVCYIERIRAKMRESVVDNF